jgi:hypothetical protein
MNLTLQLRHEPAAQQAADAWFINGNDPARWLDELARTGLSQTETRLFVISKPLTPALSPSDGERERIRLRIG